MHKVNELYRVERLPIFQNRVYDTEDEARNCVTGDVLLVEDLETGLVYNAAFRPELMVYDQNYQNEQAFSPTFRRHLDEVAEIVERHMGREGIVEVGCGKGYFLEVMLAKGVDITGFDPAYEGNNLRIKRQYFSPGVVKNSNGLVLRHVLEHIQNPVSFLEQLKVANGDRGLVYIEVPCFDWICERKAWFDIYYEHVNYFRLSDFARMFGEVIESGKLFGGQYLYVIAELASLRQPRIDMDDRVRFPKGFAEDVYIVGQDRTEQNRTAIWGAASKGVIFALLRERAGSPVDMAIDINPAKQGKFLPGSGLPVKSPEQGLADLPIGSTIFVMNSNYLDEIKKMSGNDFNYIGVDHV